MIDSQSAAPVVRFGDFEVDLRSGDLRKNGLRVGLQEQPLRVLAALLERPRELITREELRQRLWPAETFVDFEHGLNAAVKRLRDALGDSSDAPRFVETVPRRGYRFVASIGTPGAPAKPTLEGRRRSAFFLIGSLAVLVGLGTIGAWISSRRPSTSPVRIRSVAVLPFKNLTGDSSQEYFAEGMTDALRGTLSRLGGLAVVSGTSSERYKDGSRPAPQIAEELGVDALLEGAVVRSGNRVRVSAALIHARTDRRLWTQTYDRDLADVLALYAEIAQAAARETNLVLSDSQVSRLARPGTVNTQAYDEYLKGTYFRNRWLAGGCLKAEQHYLRAIQLDSSFANPHAELAWCYVFPDRVQRPMAELAPKARALTARASELDPTLASARVVLGLIRQFIDYDWDAAEQCFRQSLELDPGSAVAHNAYGDLLYMRGRPDESIVMHLRVVQLDPLSPDWNLSLAFALMNARRYDEAVERIRNTLELEPSNAAAHLNLSWALELKGDLDGAVSAYLAWLDQVLIPQRAPRARADLESAYARSGWQEFWRRELELAEEEAAHPMTIWKPPYTRYVGPAYMGLRHARLGHRDLALAFLEEAHKARHHLVASLNSNPLWDGIRSDPRFQQLVRRMGLLPS